MNKKLLERIGFSGYKPLDFKKKPIKLRDGRATNLWIHKPSGHGILNQNLWVKQDFYKGQYREQFSSNSDGKKQENEEHLRVYKKLNERQFDLFKNFLDKDAKYLEIGCSFGGVVSRVYSHGVRECHVVEPNIKDISFIQDKWPNIQAFNCSFEDANLSDNTYDIIVAFDVLEHVFYPKDFINKCHKLLKQGGRLFIIVPNHNDVLLTNYNCDSYQSFYYHKAHINYFTKNSLQYLCESLGFTGDIQSYLDYSFFNHVFWHQNNRPMGTAEGAFVSAPSSEQDLLSKKINDFYKQVEHQYEELINENLAGGALIFKGVKE